MPRRSPAVSPHAAAASNGAQAIDEFLELIRRDRKFGDDAARKTMVSVFNLIADQDELVSEYRRKLAAVLY
jgi:putative thioredoxin